MYKLPKDFDGSFFVGQILNMICFNLNQISLHFDKQTTMTVEGNLAYHANNISQQLSPPIAETNLMQLIGHNVMQATAQSNGTLSLAFDNGHILECFDSLPQYESYQISVADRTIIV